MEAVKESEKYIRIPYEFLSKGFTAAGLLTLGKIFTFSSANAKDGICRSSFKTFANDFRLSERQIARQVKELKAEKIVVQDKSRRACAAYTYAGKKCGNAFIRSDLYLYQKEFEICGEGKRYLTHSEILVLSLIQTHCGNPNAGKYTGSIRGMAKLLGLSSSTVQRCLDVLKRAHLITCESKAPNGSRWSTYRINKKLLRTKEREARDSDKKGYVDPKIAALDAKSEREHFYAVARDRANAPAEQMKARLRADERYREAERQYNRLMPMIGKYDAFGQAEESRKAKGEQKRWAAVMAERMAALNISPEDLRPRYRCVKCSDTGFLPNGQMCDCYPKGGRR